MALANIFSGLLVDSVSDIAAAIIVNVVSGVVLPLEPRYSFDEYIRRCSGCLDSRQLGVLPRSRHRW